MTVNVRKYTFFFKTPSKTSRDTLTKKISWILEFVHEEQTYRGECSLIDSLSIDEMTTYNDKLHWISSNFFHLTLTELLNNLKSHPSIAFGVEQLKLAFYNKNPFLFYPSDFTKGIGNIFINGLVWMGDIQYMKNQIKKKIAKGFKCIKLKIGGLNFEDELRILNYIRNEFSEQDLIIRLDANGAFNPKNALEKIKKLADYTIHSIEQPIKPNQLELIKNLCENSPIPIALDEELIGICSYAKKSSILKQIKPQYIILKPSILGGISASEEWIKLANELQINWWVTSALESNIALNAIAQWTYTKTKHTLIHGLGTGHLFTNNIDTPLYLDADELKFKSAFS